MSDVVVKKCRRPGCGGPALHAFPATGEWVCLDCFAEYSEWVASWPIPHGFTIPEIDERIRQFVASQPGTYKVQ